MASTGSPTFYNIINGEKRSAAKAHQVTDPRTEELLWDVPIATPEDLEEAIAAANKAFKTWGKSTIPERQAVLEKMSNVINENAAELAELARKETGKSVLMGQIEIGNTARQIKVICTSSQRPLRRIHPSLPLSPSPPHGNSPCARPR